MPRSCGSGSKITLFIVVEECRCAQSAGVLREGRETARQQELGRSAAGVSETVVVISHYRRPHMTLVWTGTGRAVPKIVPRLGSVVHRGIVEKVPSGFEGQYPNVR